MWLAVFSLLGCFGGGDDEGTTASGGTDPIDLAELDALVFSGQPATALQSGATPPSIQPAQVQAPPSDGGAGLKVIGVAPLGRVELAQQVVVQFDRKMVALGDLDAMSARVPIACEGLTGQARWAGTSTAVITAPDEQWPRSSTFSCEIPAGTTALDGATLSEAVAWDFETRPPVIQRIYPWDGARQVALDREMELIFDQPVDPAKVKPFLSLVGDGQPLAFTTAAESPEEGEEADPRVVIVRADLAPDTGYTLQVLPGVPGLEGPVASDASKQTSFWTYPPLGLRSVGPELTSEPYAVLELDFTTEVDAAEVAGRLTIEPPPPAPLELGEGWDTSYWRHGIRLNTRTTYTVTLAPGLSDVHGQVMSEGREWSFTTTDYDPMLDAPTGTLVYPANNPKTLPFKVRNVSFAEARVAPVSVEDFMLTSELWSNASGLLNGARGASFEPELERNYVGVEKLDLTPWLSDEGYGLVVVELASPQVRDYNNEIVRRRALLQVTDLGVQLKLGPNGTTAWVTRLSDGQPVASADVTLHLPGDREVSAGTDPQGVAVFPDGLLPDDWRSWDDEVWVVAKHGEDTAILNHEWRAGPGPWSFGIYSSFDSDGNQVRTHGFVDRGVYKLGDPVHGRVSARVLHKDGMDIAEGSVSWKLLDPEGSMVREGEGRLDRRGGFDVSTELPEEGALGGWGLRYDVVLTDGTEVSHYEYAPVKAYRAPSFRVDLAGPEDTRPGQDVRVDVDGRYLFGAPMPNAPVSWTAAWDETSYAPEGWDGFDFGPRWEWDSWDHYEGDTRQVLASGDDALDADGRLPVSVSLPSPEDGRPRTLSVEAQVTDPARQVVAGAARVMVHPADFYAAVKPSQGFTAAGQALTIHAAAVTPEGDAAKGREIEVTVARRTWDRVREKGMDGQWSWVSTEKDEVVAAEVVKTAGAATADGAAGFSFTPAEAGYYVIDARAEDDEGRVSLTGSSLYAWGGSASWARSDDNKLELVPDRDEYAPGDTAKILVKAPVAGLQALVTVEREGILSRRVVTLNSTAEAVDIPLADRHAPNVYVSVVAVEGAPPLDSPDGGLPQLHVGYVELNVSAEGRHLEVAVSTDRDSYQPRDEVTIDVDVTRAGQPASGAGVTLYAVDYAVLSMTSYETPDAFGSYYRKRGLSVIGADNRDRVLDRAEYLSKGGRAGGGGGGVDFDSALRTEFVTTPLWLGDLTVDGQGKASASFNLPDNLTTFRVMAVADHGADGFGAGEREITVNRPLIARPALPRFLRVGDKARAGIVLHNNTDERAEVTVTADVDGVTLTGAPRTLTVDAHGALEVPFALTDPEEGRAVLTFQVESTAGDKDAVMITLPVTRPQSREVVATSGTTTDAATEAIALPRDALTDAGGLDLKLASTVMVGLDGPVDYLLEYPHGCVEQVSSRTFAALLALDYKDQAGLDLPEAELRAAIAAGLDTLKGFETGSGGLGYWPGATSPHPVGSGWALEVLTRASDAGFDVDQKRINRLVNFERAFLSGQHVPSWWQASHTRSAQARVALSLARAGHGDAGFNASLHQERATMSAAAQAELLEALYRTPGSEGLAASVAANLAAMVRVEPTSAALVDPQPERWRSLWYSDDLATAAYLAAVVAAPGDQPLAPKLAKHVVEGRASGRWASTWATSASMVSLADYVQRYEGDQDKVKVIATLAGQELLKDTLKPGAASEASVPMASLSAGDLVMTATGGRLYYEARMTYWRGVLPARDEGFTLTRDFRLVTGAGEGGAVTPGALMEVTLEVVSPVWRYDVAVVDPLPAGLEIVDTSFTTSSAGSAASAASAGTTSRNSWYFDHTELRDDAVALFAARLPPGVHRYSYLARATTPGNYSHPAALAEEMYSPEIYGRTATGVFVVGSPSLAGK